MHVWLLIDELHPWIVTTLMEDMVDCKRRTIHKDVHADPEGRDVRNSAEYSVMHEFTGGKHDEG